MNPKDGLQPTSALPVTTAATLDSFAYNPVKTVPSYMSESNGTNAHIMRPWQHGNPGVDSRQMIHPFPNYSDSTNQHLNQSDSTAHFGSNGIGRDFGMPQDDSHQYIPYDANIPQYQPYQQRDPYNNPPQYSNFSSGDSKQGSMSFVKEDPNFLAPVNTYMSPLAPNDLTIPQTPEYSMPINYQQPHHSNHSADSAVPQLKDYDHSWESWEMFRKDAKLTELFPGHRSLIRRMLLNSKQNMREAIIHLSKLTKTPVPAPGKGQHSKLLMNELSSVTVKEEPKPEVTDEAARQKMEMESLEYERLMELYDGDKGLVERALQTYREERAAAANTESSADDSPGPKKRQARSRKICSGEDSLKVSTDAVMPPKWCTTARTRAKATTRQESPSSVLHMSDVIRDDATLAALGIPLSDEDSDGEQGSKGKGRASQGLRRPRVSDDDFKSDQSPNSESEEDDQVSSGENEEVEETEAKRRRSSGWLSKRRRGRDNDKDFVPSRGGGRKRASDDDFIVGSDECDSEEAVARDQSDQSTDVGEMSEDSGDFGAKKKTSKRGRSGKCKKSKGKSRKRKAAFYDDEEEEVSLVKSRGVRATKATKDYSEFFKKQKLVVENEGERPAGEGGEREKDGVLNGDESEASEELDDESSDEYQASSDNEEYDVGKKAKSKAKAAKMARLKAIRDARDNRRRGKKASSEEDPDFNPKGGSRGGRKRKAVINDDSDEDLGDTDFRGGAGGGSQQGKGGSEDEDSDRPFDSHLSKTDRQSITEFFNTSNVYEMQLVPGLSKKKCESIIALRPFDSWQHIVSKVRSQKGINENALVEAKTLLDQQLTLTNFLKKCEDIAKNIEKSVRNLQNRQSLDKEEEEQDDDDDLSERIQIVKQPQLLNSDFKLKPYQIIGVNWLYVMFKHNTNAVLSDEMGLGKTIQTIAFLAYLKENNDVTGKHMIVAPASTLENWAREFTDWCPSLKLFLYYGSQEERMDLRRRALSDHEDFDVIITTYNVCISNKLDRSLFKKLNIQYMVIDEGHMLRNMSSIRYQQLMRIKADSRLLLTGTPLQNNLVELVSVLTFVMPHLFSQHTEAFKTHFQACANKGVEDSSEYEFARIEQAKMIMKPFMLRRLKKDVIKQLPPKKELIVKCHMDQSQRDCYNDIKLALAKTFKDRQEGIERKKDSSLSNAMMQLRKATNHKLLHRRIFTVPMMTKLAKMLVRTERFENSNEHLVVEDLTVMSDFEIHQLCQDSVKTQKFCLKDEDILDSAKIRQLDVLLPEIKKKQEKVLLFSQFTIVLDILQEYLSIRKHKFIRLDGTTSVEQRLLMIDEFNKSSAEECFVFLLSTRAGGLGINLASANHVIIHDIDFNPYNDKQAEDRAHRVGQEKEVCVYRLIVEDSIDEGMLAIAEEKLKLEENLTANTYKAVVTDCSSTPAGSDNEDSNSVAAPPPTTDVATLLGSILDL